MEAEFEKDKYTPTEEELNKLEEELVKLNEQKFGTLEGPIGSDGHDDSGVDGIKEPQKKTGYFPEKKVLNYLRRDA
jgi:hypothetical protein